MIDIMFSIQCFGLICCQMRNVWTTWAFQSGNKTTGDIPITKLNWQ